MQKSSTKLIQQYIKDHLPDRKKIIYLISGIYPGIQEWFIIGKSMK
jgi:hypothetical protein